MNTPKLRPISSLLTTLIAGLACSASAHAVDVFWSGTTDSDWGTATNWLGTALPTADARIVFDVANLSGELSSIVNNALSTPTYNQLAFNSGGFSVTGSEITLRPSISSSTVIANFAGSNTIAAPLRIDPNKLGLVLSDLDDARISVSAGSLTLQGAVTAGLVDLTTSVGAGATLTMNNVSAKSFLASGGTQHLQGGLNSTTVDLSTNFVVGGAGGAISATGGTTMGAGSQLTLDNTATASNNRLSGNLTMAAGTTFLLKGNAATEVTNSAGVLTINGSNTTLTHVKVEGAGANASMTFGSLTSTGLVNFASSGTLGGAEQIKFTTAPTLANGLMSRALVNGKEFASYNATNGVIAATTATTLSGATAADHVYLSAAENLAGNSAINSLAVNNAAISGGGVISLASGKLLTNGTVNIAPSVNFGSSYGEIINMGNLTLAGGVNGSNGLTVLGNGALTLAHAGSLTGSFNHSGQLILGADNALQGADLIGAAVNLGGTYQRVNSFNGSVAPTNGTIDATNDISLVQDLAFVNLNGKNVNVSSGVFSGNIRATHNASLFGSYYGVISGSANVSVNGTFYGQNTYGGATTGNLTLSSSGSIVNSGSFTGTGLSIVSSSLYGNLQDRIGDNKNVTLIGGIPYSGQVPGALTLLNNDNNSTLYEDVGVLTFDGGATGLNMSAAGVASTTSLRANSLILANGSELTLSLDSNSSFYVDTAPVVFTGTNILKGVSVQKSVNGGYLPSWVAYDSSTGRISEALVTAKTLSSADSNEFVRVTDVTNVALAGFHTVGGVNIDTTQTMSGSGTLTVGSGQLLFWKDNTINITNLNFGTQQGVVTNAGSNTIASVIAGSNGLLKKGGGTLVLTANNTYTGTTRVAQGVLSVTSGGRIGDVSVDFYGRLDLAGTARIISNSGTVNLNAAYTNAAGTTIGGGGFINVNAVLSNQGAIDNVVNNTGSVSNSGHIDSVQNFGNGSLTNATGASIRYVRHDSATTFTNAGTVDSLYNLGTVVNNGTVNGIRLNSGTFTNHGTLLLDGASFSGTVINTGTASMNADSSASGGTYTQTAGTTTINGELHSNVQLQGGFLKGSGAIFGNVTVSDGAQVNPGNSPGSLTINGDFNLQSGSVLNLEVASINGVLKFDELVVTGTFTKSGTINFNLGAGVTFDVDADVRTFTSAGQTVNLTDMFSLNLLPGLIDTQVSVVDASGGVTAWTIAATDIPAVPVPEPETYAMMLAGLGLVGWAARRRKAEAAL